MSEVYQQLRASRVVVVVKVPDVACARPLGEALLAGGLSCVEVTFRSEAAQGAIEALAGVEGLLVGAGTVRSVRQADAAREAGARFVVGPGTQEEVVRHCVKIGLPICPGVCTPSEVERALSFGVEVLKFFPASVFGGTAALKAFGAVYPEVPFIPTGGINATNLAEYLALKNVLACGGSWLAETSLLVERNFDEVQRRAREASELARAGG